MYRKWERNEPPVTIYSPHFPPSAWCPIILKTFNVDHTYSGIWKVSFHQSWNLKMKLWLLYYECAELILEVSLLLELFKCLNVCFRIIQYILVHLLVLIIGDFGSFRSWITGSHSAYIIGTQTHAYEQCKEQERQLLLLSIHGVCTLSMVSASCVECGVAQKYGYIVPWCCKKVPRGYE
jgi:hypothetical protein